MSNNYQLSQSTNSPQSFRNKIINGNFDIWQRGTSHSVSGYGSVDRWSTLITLGATQTVSRTKFDPGQLGESAYCATVTFDSGANAGSYAIFTQRIEDVRNLAGKTATLSFWAKSDVTRDIAIEFSQAFGTGGAPSPQVTGIGVQRVTLAPVWTKYSVTVALPSIVGKVIGSAGDDYLQLLFWFGAGSNFDARTASLGHKSGSVNLSQVQLEEGNVATPFERRPIGLELSLCQRYYEDSSYQTGYGSGYCVGMWVVTANASFGVQFKTTKRATPGVVTVRAATSGNLDKVRDDTAATEVSVTGKYGYGASGFLFIVGASAAAGNRALWHYTADAEL